MADDAIRLPTSSFDQLSRIIQGYAQVNKAASLADITKRTGINNTVVSGNTAFLVAIGVLEGGKSKAVTPIGKRLGDALHHAIEPEVARCLQEIVEESEFLRSVVAAVRIRKGMDEGSFRSHIAYSAGMSKTAGSTTGAGTVIELLRRAGVVEDREGKLVASTIPDPPVSAPISDQAPIPATSPARLQDTLRVEGVGGSRLSITVEVRVDCKPHELQDLGVQLKRLVQELSKSEDQPDETA